jgi:DNA-binding CsgD family transcriptional regulator
MEDTPSRRFTVLKDHPYAFWVALGLGALGIWMNLVGYSPFFAPDEMQATRGGDFTITRYAFYSGIIICALVFCIFSNQAEHYFKQNKVSVDLIAGVCMFVSTFCFAGAYRQEVLDPLLFASASCFVSGVCYMLFLVAFYVRLAKNESMKAAILSVAASLLIELIFDDVFSVVLSRYLHLILGALMPCVAAAILLFAIKPIEVKKINRSYLTGKERTYHLALIFVASFASIAVMAASTAGPTAGLWGTRTENLDPLLFNILALVVVAIVFLVFSYFTLIKHINDRVSVRYQLPFLVLVAGCILLIINEFAFPRTLFSIEAIVVTAIGLFSHLVSWAIIISFMQTVKFPTYRILGLRAIFFNALALTWMKLFEGNDRLVTSVVLLIVFLVVFGITAVPLNINKSAAAEIDIFKTIAEKYGLTQREQEVFILLAQGRSRPYIQKQLYLADGTVKTHSSHIYTKLDVHSRQEMLDLIAREKDGR